LSVMGACVNSHQPAHVEEKAQVAVHPELWPVLNQPALDPAIEQRVTNVMAKMTLEQKIGQVIQADTGSITPQEVKEFRLGSVLSGGNSAPGGAPYADAAAWLAAADAYFEASIDPEGVEIAIPVIWGIDAVHGHANLSGATVFPHNIGLGAARDPDLIEQIMEITATELIISGHDWTFAPTLAVPRDDRWGRTYEGFSEDPDIVASYADRIVYGLQGRPGTDTFFDATSVISSAKHFLGDGGTTNGVDQGDTEISEAELINIHARPYLPAIEADVKTIMASFNSWNGRKMHGYKGMLTDVLKGRMGFNGFVIGDWNGHGQIPGCTNTDCPESFMAGVDMYMAPDSWKGTYGSLLASVQSGEVPIERLDDAVRRILRVKMQAGLFEKAKPSQRPGAGATELLGSAAHRDVARRAVRGSLVLLKNNDRILPVDGRKTVLVLGEGADSISKQAGGWTLSWQGGGYANSDFPNGNTILDGIREAVHASGGRVIYDPSASSDVTADVVIAVYGEDPYAEFQGDRDHLDFAPKSFDTTKLAAYRAGGIPVVSVFLSGRPLWVNPELNASDAFVAAWLPGTEGGGVADVLFQTDPSFDFTGRLSYSWPATATDFDNNLGSEGYDPLFPLGYGLSYGEPHANMAALSEDSGLDQTELVEQGAIFRRGRALTPWKAYLVGDDGTWVLFNGTGANVEGLSATRSDHLAQEDGIALRATASGKGLAFMPEGEVLDWSSDAANGKSLAFALKSDAESRLDIGFVCQDDEPCAAPETIPVTPGNWREVHIPLNCFASQKDLREVNTALLFVIEGAANIGIADVRLVNTTGERPDCSS
jgi:beta-glucosidase